MSNLDRYLLVCDPLPQGADTIRGWRQAVQGVAQIILDAPQSSPWEMAEVLARITVDGRLGSDGFGTRAAAVVAGLYQTRPDATICSAAFARCLRQFVFLETVD